TLPAERRAVALFRGLLARRAGALRRAVRRLPDVAGDEGRTCRSHEGRARACGKARTHARLRAARPHDRARHRGGGAGICPRARLQARRRAGQDDSRAGAGCKVARRFAPGEEPRAGRCRGLCRAASVDRCRPGKVRMRGGPGGLDRPGAVGDRGLYEDGHPGLHLLRLSASRRMPAFRHEGAAAAQDLLAAARLRPGTAFHAADTARNRGAHLMDRLERGEAAAGVAAPMERVELAPGLSLARIVYGMWRLCDDEDTSPAQVQAKIESCLEQGITSLDQADIYGGYRAEGVLGRCLKAAPHLRDKVEIVTKCDIVAPAGRYAHAQVKHYDTSAAQIARSDDLSLNDIGVERIDLLLIHRPDPLMDPHETGAALDAAVRSGRVRAIGVSNFRPWDWTLLQSSMENHLVTNRIELSLLSPGALTN